MRRSAVEGSSIYRQLPCPPRLSLPCRLFLFFPFSLSLSLSLSLTSVHTVLPPFSSLSIITLLSLLPLPPSSAFSLLSISQSPSHPHMLVNIHAAAHTHKQTHTHTHKYGRQSLCAPDTNGSVLKVWQTGFCLSEQWPEISSRKNHYCGRAHKEKTDRWLKRSHSQDWAREICSLSTSLHITSTPPPLPPSLDSAWNKQLYEVMEMREDEGMCETKRERSDSWCVFTSVIVKIQQWAEV